MLSIPREMDEAAKIDGAGNIRIFFQIIIPLAKPGMTAAGILTFLGNWNEFFYALLLTGSDQVRTLPVVVFNFTSQFRGNLGAMFASMIIIITPTIIIYSIASEQVVKSLSAGAVKG
jgi:raffinose/stachyose/melibiose transport system permease protein